MKKTYYEILGIDDKEKGLSEKEFKKVLSSKYKKLARKYHPDVNPNKEEAEEKFKEIAEAYSILSDSEKKQKYDLELQYGSMDGSFGGFTDMFNKFGGFGGFGNGMFGGFSQQQRVEIGEDIYANINVSLEDIYQEKLIEVFYRKNVPCHYCNGSGAEGDNIKTCTTCNGSGMITETKVQGNMVFNSQRQCNVCGGKGKIITKQCSHCNGSGFENIKTSLKIKIPKGVFNDSTMLMNGYGDLPKSANGRPGNLILVFHIKPHDYFKIINGFLVHEESVPFTDCLLGCKRTVKALGDKEIIIDIPELTENGTKYTFSEGGMWEKPYVVFIRYELPKQLTDKQKELLQEFKKEDEK